MNREFFLGLGITLLTSAILFLYFRNRFKVMEHKVNTIFQLVQSHARAPPPPFYQKMEPSQPVKSTATVPNSLIEVSDDEYSDSGEESSDEESDTEGTNLILSENVKKISVLLGTEINKMPTEINLAEKINDLDDVTSLDDVDESDNDSIHDTPPQEENPPLQLDSTAQDYNKFTVRRLKELAAEKGKTGFTKMRKTQLVELLSN